MEDREATKGRRTRERVIADAAPLFNRRGYAGTSIADLVQAVGLERGGIYRHFAGKDELAMAALEHALRLYGDRVRAHVERAEGAVARLSAFAAAMATTADDPAVPGGCPLMNTTVECDDGEGPPYDALRERARQGMRDVIGFARRIMEEGMAAGELPADVDAAAEAERMVAEMEGALVLSRLFADARYVRDAAGRIAARARGWAARA
ncbi:helix-turn-helix domain-containing protein [Longimicrobium sp.]|uniref:helix-turn-helix domain-containing protein n=1 Tax=Longimicrobium sp. TaxID=2029185 RepID=UPI002E365844|nr:helix-turn-helix domain-containing protein [Longimicrobium sp.]HEX6039916.1 helix-turn-helix domain-containing protein [Longimicrobium sp.]